MHGRTRRRWWGAVATSVLSLVLLGCSFVDSSTALVPPSEALAEPLVGIRVGDLAGYEPAGSLGFRLRDTPIVERVYRRVEGAERGLIWTAQFASRWPLTEDQLDRWSAQAIGHLADGLEASVRLAGWERLAADDIGEQRVAYRYRLATPSGTPAGEATIVVFARGDQVGLTGTAVISGRLPLDASDLARALDGALS
jgi:hypothetical protein